MGTSNERNRTFDAISGNLNNAWLSAVVQNLPQAVLLEDEHHLVQIANEQLCKLFNLPGNATALNGKRSAELFAEVSGLFEHPEQYQERIRTLVKEKIASQKELVRLKDGRFLLRDYIPLWQDGVLTGHMWMFSEETSRIKADILLKEQQKFYEDVLGSIPSDVAVFSPDHRYLYINPVGLKDPELRKWLIGKDDFDYCAMRGKDPSFAQKRRDIFNSIVASGKEKEWEERIVNRHGEVEHHLRRMSPLYDDNGQLVWVIGYSVNITERKKFEEKIQLSEKRYRDLFNYSQAIICTHDLDGNFLSANPALLDVLGYTEAEIIGKNISRFLQPEDRNAFQDLYLRSITETNNKIKGLFRILHKNGKKVYLLYQNYRVEETPGTAAYVIAFAQDVSDRIRVEKELKVAKRITEETARNKEMFLANMSHEIRTPMNGILGITSFLQRTPLNPEQQKYLNIIQESAKDLLTIINEILDLEKVGTGKIQLEKIPFDVVGKTTTVIRLFEVAAQNKGNQIQLENELGDRLCVLGDPTRFSQVMNNLVSNAVKFTQQGKIIVRLSLEENTDKGVVLHVSVKDSGIGIDGNNMTRIFQPFTQAYPDTARKYGGTGLGLAISKHLLLLQNGDIWVDSVPGRGSSFHFTIPFEKCKSTLQHPVSQEPTINALGELNVLLAEDNEVNQMLTEGMLQFLGFRATVASSGTEAVELIKEQEFDLVLMDIQMPGKNGFAATKEIRGLHSARNTVPIIALTANALQGEEEKYFEAGMNGYLTKPFSESALYGVIKEVLENKNRFTTIIKKQEKEMSDTAPSEKLYDLSLVKDLARGSEEFILNLAKIFIDTVPPTAREMTEACVNQKWDQTGKLAHKLKSTIDTMCINSLKDDIRLIEKYGKEQKNLEDIPPLVSKTDRVIGLVTEQLKAEFNL